MILYGSTAAPFGPKEQRPGRTAPRLGPIATDVEVYQG